MCEPWCWPPEVVDRLTDAEIEDIRAAQAERVRRLERSAAGGGPTPAPDIPPGGRAPPPERTAEILAMLRKAKDDAARRPGV